MSNWPYAADNSRLLPFLWLKGEGEEALRRGVADAHEAGCGAVCAESRTHPDFLGPGWWRDIGVLLEECAARGMKLWIFDDQHFPSGYAAGRATGTPLTRLQMRERHMDVKGPVKGGAFVVQPDGWKPRPGEGTVAVIAARRLDESDLVATFEDVGGWKLGERIDLTDRMHDGMVYWDVPEGIWRVFLLTAEYAEGRPPRGCVNHLLPGGAQLMIDTIYEPHYRHFAEHFGRTLAGFFSDEPALSAGRGYHAVIGEFPRIPIPWRPDMIGILREALGEDAVTLLPGLWYDIGAEDCRRVRYAMMDVVSRLYGENYAMPIGDWCRAHGVEYIGHVIEQNNTHCRLGNGTGHFFRAMSGQDMAGVDIVLHEIRPELRGTSHAWVTQDFEADDDFFRYMLGQMAVSCAHLDPKKRGRTLCENFGAFGWQEDAAEMRYLANLMLSRGVNHFVPHAFTLAGFPDPDCPPHFDPRHHPMTPAFGRLFRYMARVGSLIDGGRHISRTAVLYYAEGEWANGSDGCMQTQAVVRELNRRQIECEIVPIDQLESADFALLLIPGAKSWPRKLLDSCRLLMAQGKQVRFVGELPVSLSEGSGDVQELLDGMAAIPLENVAACALRLAPLPYAAVTEDDRIHLYPYCRGSERFYLLFNEDVQETVRFTLSLEDDRPCYVLDAEEESCRRAEQSGSQVTAEVEPGQLLILRQGDEPLACDTPLPALDDGHILQTEWAVSVRSMGEREFTPYGTITDWFNVNAPEHLPRFCGTVRYEAEIDLAKPCLAIDLGRCGGVAEVYLDGEKLPERIAPPWRFRLPGCTGLHRLRIEVANTPVYAVHDALSFYACLKPTGVQGPVMLFGPTQKN